MAARSDEEELFWSYKDCLFSDIKSPSSTAGVVLPHPLGESQQPSGQSRSCLAVGKQYDMLETWGKIQ